MMRLFNIIIAWSWALVLAGATLLIGVDARWFWVALGAAGTSLLHITLADRWRRIEKSKDPPAGGAA